MKALTGLCLLVVASFCAFAAENVPAITPIDSTDDLKIKGANVRLIENLDLLVFEINVNGVPGRTVPRARGSLNGAPVLGYVLPTNLNPTDVGFAEVDGIVALAITSHPDFDDTPLWDEDNDRDYANDGVVFHTHWVVLTNDERVNGGLAVLQLDSATDKADALPPTNPGMPMYMDSPGFSVVIKGDSLRALVPLGRVNNRRDFQFDAVTAYMQVMQSGDYPLLGVYEVYDVWSGDLSLPGRVKKD